MLDYSVMDELPTTTRIRTKPKRGRDEMPEKRVRWRMTLDELCYVAGIEPNLLDEWADKGWLGKRCVVRPIRGRSRQITREMAQRTVLVARLVRAGLHPEAAGHVAQGHMVNDHEPLTAELPGGVIITITRSDLP